jgi:formylglycine-generating enzyme required for sulfatase activity
LSKHTILVLAANPVGTSELALGREARAIQVELERTGFRSSFEFVTRWATEPLDLLRELRTLSPTVVHFSGHGIRNDDGVRGSAAEPHRDVVAPGGADGLMFQDADGQLRLVSTTALQDAFDAAGSSVRLVVLSACYSESQAAALRSRVDCVVGMRGSIGDAAARSFAIGFYGGLGDRASVAAAYKQGCAAIRLQGLADGDKPQLVVRDGVDAESVVLADLASCNPPVRPRGSVLPPTPVYLNAEVQALSEQLGRARQRQQNLRNAGIGTDEVDREILELRRKLRDGGQLRAGDALGDGRYLLVKPVGRGGFAVVWQAWDRTEQRLVAIKVLHHHLASDSQRRERFFRGARVMMDLKHPAVVRVLDPKGEDESFCYFVMELMPGGNLRETVLGNRVAAEHRLTLILQVGEALAEAHRKQLIHRDIKPANILLDEQGNANLTDFDLVGAHDTTGGTRTGALGTVVYAAPECLDKPQDATPRADVYGLGMTAIFGLVGRELSLSTFRDPESTIVGLDCSAEVKAVLRRSVAWEPEQRYADAGEMVAALKQAQAEPEQAALASMKRAAEDASRRRAGWAVEGWAVESGDDSYGPWAAFEVSGVQHRMRWIPSGTFFMGTPPPEPGDGDEKPQHKVTITRGYWLGETPVTQALWGVVMGENPIRSRGEWTDDLERPVEQVSWKDCQRFLDLLNAQVAGLAARLPTEAEWERACRAGTTTATWVGEFSGKSEVPELDAIAWYGGSSANLGTRPVGRKAPNPYGLHDMLGNVWEWCADNMRHYSTDPVTDPVGGAQDAYRVARGGSWISNARFVRAAYRYGISRDNGRIGLGFRLAGGQAALR